MGVILPGTTVAQCAHLIATKASLQREPVEPMKEVSREGHRNTKNEWSGSPSIIKLWVGVAKAKPPTMSSPTSFW